MNMEDHLNAARELRHAVRIFLREYAKGEGVRDAELM